ncbi:MAG TPA: amidohydrolase family protein [Verrucomicrobiota bacterium]|nr:amidohydrolase family protein [Verrucomicrobiota bacterium]
MDSVRSIGQTELIPPATVERRVWLRVGALLDGVSTRPLRDAHVVYDAEKILFVGETSPPAHLLNPGQCQPDADLPDHTLLPGLIEAHAHLFLEGGELDLDKRADYLTRSPADLLAAARTRLEKLVRLGVIAVRDAGDKDGVGLALSKLYRSAERPLMPYLDSPGAAIHHKGRYGGFMADAIENHATPRDCVASRVNAGADRIKLIPTGIINFKQGAVTTQPQMTIGEVLEIVAAAQSFGKQTFAHASGDAGIERAIEGGVDSVEHGFFVRDDQLAKMRDRGIAWVPTFAPVQEQVDHADLMRWDGGVVSNLKRILDQHAASLVRAHAMGVRIIAGSDAGSVGVAHGLGFYYELELMERAGLAPLAVINSATGASSDRLEFKEPFGRMQAGFQSRFILTRHSPLQSVSNLRKQKTVVFDVEVFGDAGEIETTGL